MKTVTVTPRSKAVQAFLEQAKEQDLLVRTPDGTEFVVSALDDDFAEEVRRTRRNKKLKAFLQERARKARTSELVPLSDIKRRFGIK